MKRDRQLRWVRAQRKDRQTTHRRGRNSRRRLWGEGLEPRRVLAFGDFLAEFANPGVTNQAGAEAGYAIDVDGNLAVGGAPGADANGVSNVGQVLVYDHTSGALLRTLANPYPQSGDRFGHAVAISGTTIVVGNHVDDAGAVDSGQAYVFDALTGDLLHTLTNPTPGPFDYFGFAVDIEGDRIAIGAYLDDAFGTDAGTVHLFNTATGGLVQSLGRPGATAFDYFGYSLALTSQRLAVSAYRVDVGATDDGAVLVFDRASLAVQQTIVNPTPRSSTTAPFSSRNTRPISNRRTGSLPWLRLRRTASSRPGITEVRRWLWSAVRGFSRRSAAASAWRYQREISSPGRNG